MRPGFFSLIILNIFSIVNGLSMIKWRKGSGRGAKRRSLGRARGEEVARVISYEPFYRTLYKKNITEYQLIFKHGVSANTLHRIKHGQTITLKTLDTLCFILDCPVSDVIEYRRDAE